MYTWITRHSQVVQSPISNYCLKVRLDDQKEPQLVPKFLSQVSVRELYNRLVRDPNVGGLKDSMDEDGKIFISDSTLRSLLPPQLKQMSACYKIMRGCEYCISAKSIHSSFLFLRDTNSKNYRIKDKMLKTEGLVRNNIAYIQQIKYSDTTWASYLCQSI